MFLVLYIFVSTFSRPVYDDFSNQFSEFYKSQLVSTQKSPPSEETLNRPVFITAHGFGASPFEWSDFSDYMASHTNALVSNVYLGGHDSLEKFSKARWEDWLNPICQEYQRLVNLGFETIYLCGCSTGSTLLIQGLLNNCFRPTLPLKHIFLIDSLVEPKQKMIYWLPWIKPFIYDQTLMLNHHEASHWLPYRPKESLTQLLRLIKKTKDDLNNGIPFPDHIKISLFQSKYDPVIDTISHSKLYQGLSKLVPRSIQCFTLHSYLHVFTRLSKRSHINSIDIDNQNFFFNHVKESMII
ncbi:hypothetical protein CL658_02695 [bacterium]|nr:hypothetical protein [bacterium]|tara:strand:+ start:2287 stop:3177 length:891 start_codon:yes stop_codon:yes gene_type:complete